jgi:hypothetical protein
MSVQRLTPGWRQPDVGRLPGRPHTGHVSANDIAKRLVELAHALQHEIHLVSDLFQQTDFLGDANNLPHAHYGYLMAILGQIDTLSVCHGENAGQGQTPRMTAFLDRYVHPGRLDVHRAVVQMLRHTLMHTGALRYLYDPDSKIAYTWRVYFDDLPGSVAHYTLTQIDPAYQDDLRDHARLARVTPTSIVALNISLTALSTNLARGTNAYVADMLADQAKRDRVEAEYPKIQMQQKPISRPS